MYLIFTLFWLKIVVETSPSKTLGSSLKLLVRVKVDMAKNWYVSANAKKMPSGWGLFIIYCTYQVIGAFQIINIKKPVFMGDLCHQLNLITRQLKTTVDSQKRCVLREKTWAHFHQPIQKGIPEYNDYLRLDSRVPKAFKLAYLQAT